MKQYNPSEIEPKWQKTWDECGSVWQAKDFSKKPKFYTLFEFPYPSGEGLHMGHLRGQTAVDVYARKKRLEGYNVLTPIGWDAFGLPTENYAIKNKIHPAEATKKNIESIKKQEKMLGYFLDWPREINTTDPKYYKWTQWIFLQLFKHGLAYKADMPINWCSSCKIGLANEEVINEKCERCASVTSKRNVSQWLLKITKYADKLIEGLKDLDFPDRVKTQQINWIGRKDGINITYDIDGSDEKVTVFTTRPDTNYGATFLVIAPEHPLVKKITTQKNKVKVEKYIKETIAKSDLERQLEGRKKTGAFTGSYAINQLTKRKMPIYVADFVLMNFQTGAVVGVPGHDLRDFEFAKEFNLTIIRVVVGKDGDISEITQPSQVQELDGKMINSGILDGLDIHEATEKITDYIERMSWGKKTVSYKLRDWIFSRQHYWGEPIPIINCNQCKAVPVPEKDLPVLLPDIKNYQPTDTGESPLAKIDGWVNVTCPNCGGKAKRETDTMPNWAGSSWYFLRYIDPDNDAAFADGEKLKYWLPVDLYEGGMEHTTLHLLYSRFWNEFLYDIKAVPLSEPYTKRVPHGIILAGDGRKMSKSFGNIIKPDEIVKKFGADTTRTYAMFIGPFNQAISWDENGLQGVWRFLNKVWKNILKEEDGENEELGRKFQFLIKEVSADIEDFKMNTAVAKLMEFNNLLFAQKQISRDIKIKYLKLLYPFAPHVCEELNQYLKEDCIFKSEWPKYDLAKLREDKVTVVVQINGKKRATIECEKGASEDQLLDEIGKTGKITEEIKNGVKKIIFVQDKILNIVK